MPVSNQHHPARGPDQLERPILEATACREGGAPPGHGLLGFCGGLPGSRRPWPTGPGRPRPAGGCETLVGHGLPGRRGPARPRPARVLRGPAGPAQAVAYWAGAGVLAGLVPWLKQVQEPRRLGRSRPFEWLTAA
eukprot:scaffold22064_cov112-Isochrysis_galbana.AAC.1